MDGGHECVYACVCVCVVLMCVCVCVCVGGGVMGEGGREEQLY